MMARPAHAPAPHGPERRVRVCWSATTLGLDFLVRPALRAHHRAGLLDRKVRAQPTSAAPPPQVAHDACASPLLSDPMPRSSTRAGSRLLARPSRGAARQPRPLDLAALHSQERPPVPRRAPRRLTTRLHDILSRSISRARGHTSLASLLCAHGFDRAVWTACKPEEELTELEAEFELVAAMDETELLDEEPQLSGGRGRGALSADIDTDPLTFFVCLDMNR